MNKKMLDKEYIKDLSWNDVFAIWRESEENLPHWIEIYTAKNFDSWEEWRSGAVKSLKLDERKWKLYTITDPIVSVPLFYGGPFKSWREKYYEGKNFVTFSELVKNPEIQNKSGINEMKDNFPEQAEFIGLQTEKGIVIIEGMHRCSAIALAAQEGRTIETNATIALAKFSIKELTEIIDR